MSKTLTGMDTTAKVRTLSYRGRLYAFNGRNRMRTFDGVAWTLAGIDRADFTPTGSGTGTGLTGTYRYFVTPANSNKRTIDGRMLEGIPSHISAEITVSNQSIQVASIPSTHPDPQVNCWNIYRNKNGVYDTDLADEDQDFFFVATVPIGTTTYTDSTADDALTGAERLRFNQNTPPTFKFARIFGDRMYCWGFDPITTGTVAVNGDPTKIDFSGIALPDGVKGCWFQVDDDPAIYAIQELVTTTQIKLDRAYVGSAPSSTYRIFRRQTEVMYSNFLDVEAWGPDADDDARPKFQTEKDALTAGIQYQGNLLLFSAHAIYAVTGKGPNEESLQMLPEPIFRGIGCVSGDAMCQADNEIHFLSTRGPAKLAGGEPVFTGLALNNDWMLGATGTDALTADNAALACMGSDDEEIFLSVSSALLAAGGTAYNQVTFRYDRARDAWWPETEWHPTQYIREDGDNGQTCVLYALQDRFIIRPKYGTLDIVAAALSGTVSSATTTTFTTATTLPTSSGGLEQCYVRFYRNGIPVGTRMLTSNTSTVGTWSSSGPGGGTLSVQAGDTFEIGNIGWRWQTRSDVTPAHLEKALDVHVQFDAISNTQTIGVHDIVDGVSYEATRKPYPYDALELATKHEPAKASREFAILLSSRTGAVIRNVNLDVEVEEETK